MAKRDVTGAAKRWWQVLAVIVGVAMLALPASAKPRHAAGVSKAPREAGEPIMAIVSTKSQRITLYDADGWILRAPVSTGIAGRETPAGVFAVIEKDKDHHSTLYDDAWMPNMQRITWNGVALHGGPLPGYAASHGCVRMPYDFAEGLFDQTRIGMRVIVSPIDAEPVDFTHPLLFQPDDEAIAEIPERTRKLAFEAQDAARAAEDAKKQVTATSTRETTLLFNSLRKLERLKARADADLAYATKTLARSKSPQAPARLEQFKQKADTVASQLEAAEADAKPKLEAAKAAKDAAKEAEAKKTETAKALSDAKLAQEPVSVFISRSTQKLYVRRNTHKAWPDGGEVFDTSIEVPVTIRNPEQRIGTHIFTAMARQGSTLRWSAVTIDASDTAKDALDRITIPKEILDRIGPTVLPRSSIVVSDEPLSAETNYRTEFVVVLNNYPHGGFQVRRPSVEIPIASDDYDNGGGFFFFPRRSSSSGYEPGNGMAGGRRYYPQQQQQRSWW